MLSFGVRFFWMLIDRQLPVQPRNLRPTTDREAVRRSHRGNNDPAADPVCSYVFPVTTKDGKLITATRDFLLKFAFLDSGLYVDGIPDRLYGISIKGHYRELGD
ncbi:hypothetical protein HB771_09255 [Rhizobium leguminosarum bv. viciae]|nr:hypothetical protein HB771_09255 [Rhizobium leguminosarum bv. viciae]